LSDITGEGYEWRERCDGTAKNSDGILRDALLSECGRYRWWLRRSWEGGDGRSVCFVMLNPSTADSLVDDPTIRRCVGFARSWGYSSLVVRNLFALRATNPDELLTAPDPTGGEEGDRHLRLAGESDRVVAAWGAGAPFARPRRALELLAGVPLYCLGVTKNGDPRHPLYVKAGAPLVPFTPNASETESSRRRPRVRRIPVTVYGPTMTKVPKHRSFRRASRHRA
jgi:hypothetical protein